MEPVKQEPDGGYGPRELDETTPNSARLYDYYLGGSQNFQADRDLAARILAQAPAAREGARANRAFLRRAVRFLVSQGVEQFLDLGSGIPTADNVHEIAQRANPAARVVYVDYEPVAYHTAKKLLAGIPSATILQADLRDPDAVLGHPGLRQLLDFTRPIGLLLIGVLLFVPDDDRPAELIARYRNAMPSGSYLALSHPSLDAAIPEVRGELDRIQDRYRHATERFHVRSKAEISSWFAGTDLIDPGVVPYADWRPEAPITPEQRRGSHGYVGIGRIAGLLPTGVSSATDTP